MQFSLQYFRAFVWVGRDGLLVLNSGS